MDIKTAEDLLKEDAEAHVYDLYKSVTHETLDDRTRWSVYYSQVWENTADGTLWLIAWSRGATEYQDEGIEDVTVIEVEKKEVLVSQYVPKVNNV